MEGFLDASLEAYKQSRAFVFETRVVASYYEMLKHKHLHREASLILNRMTGEVRNGEESLLIMFKKLKCVSYD